VNRAPDVGDARVGPAREAVGGRQNVPVVNQAAAADNPKVEQIVNHIRN
jgi:hypothetical protein